MQCPQCQHANPDDGKFCTACAAPLGQAPERIPAASAPTPATAAAPTAAQSSSGCKTALVVLGVLLWLLLLVAGGMYVAFHMIASKVRTALDGDTQTSAQTTAQAGSGSNEDATTRTTANVIGAALGTDAKGKADIGKALGNLEQTGEQIAQHDRATGNANGAPDAQDAQAAISAAGNLAGAMAGSLGGAHRHDPLDFHVLQSMLPMTVSDLTRGIPKGESSNAMGIKASGAQVDFTGAGNALVTVSIKDATAVSSLAGIAELADAQESEQGSDYEKNETLGGYRVHEKWDASSKHGELSLIVGKRFGVDVVGDNVDMDVLKGALAQIDLRKLEAMRDANPQKP